MVDTRVEETLKKIMGGNTKEGLQDLRSFEYEETGELNSMKVLELFLRCMFDEIPDDDTLVVPVINSLNRHIAFDPEMIEKYKGQIKVWLDQMNPTFKKGWSLIKAPFDKNNRQWGEQIDADRLFSLGCAAGLCEKMNMPGFLIAILGGVPYFKIFEEPKEIIKIKKKDIYTWDRGKTNYEPVDKLV